MLKNYGTDPGNFQMKQKVESKWSLYTMLPIESKYSNFTLRANKIKAEAPKFDGLACSDGRMAFRFLNSYSSAAFKTISLDDRRKTITLEFWFKVPNPSDYKKKAHLFSLFDIRGDMN